MGKIKLFTPSGPADNIKLKTILYHSTIITSIKGKDYY